MKSLYLLVGLCLLLGRSHGQPLEAEVMKTEVDSRDERPLKTLHQELYMMDSPKPLTVVTTSTEGNKCPPGMKPIAFTATNPVVNYNYNLVYRSKTLDPVPLMYTKVVTNIGGAYNVHTGIFTAPLPGVYYFSAHSFFEGENSPGVTLFHNNKEIVSWYGQVSGSNAAVLQLRTGDSVFVGIWQKYDNENCRSSFSGYFLYPMCS